VQGGEPAGRRICERASAHLNGEGGCRSTRSPGGRWKRWSPFPDGFQRLWSAWRHHIYSRNNFYDFCSLSLFNNSFAMLAKCLDCKITNTYKNYDDLCIGRSLGVFGTASISLLLRGKKQYSAR
jgi:hypothetical protein